MSWLKKKKNQLFCFLSEDYLTTNTSTDSSFTNTLWYIITLRFPKKKRQREDIARIIFTHELSYSITKSYVQNSIKNHLQKEVQHSMC